MPGFIVLFLYILFLYHQITIQEGPINLFLMIIDWFQISRCRHQTAHFYHWVVIRNIFPAHRRMTYLNGEAKDAFKQKELPLHRHQSIANQRVQPLALVMLNSAYTQKGFSPSWHKYQHKIIIVLNNVNNVDLTCFEFTCFLPFKSLS